MVSLANPRVVTKQYSLIPRFNIEYDPERMERMDKCMRNESLFGYGYYIETCVRSVGCVASIPGLMVLLKIQPVTPWRFEKFLANHNAVANWTGYPWWNHATHLWARNVLIDHEPINITRETSKN